MLINSLCYSYGSGSIAESAIWIGAYALIMIAKFSWLFMLCTLTGIVIITFIPRNRRMGRRWKFIGIAHVCSIIFLIISTLEPILNQLANLGIEPL